MLNSDISRRALLQSTLACSAGLTSHSTLWAQSPRYPTRPVRMVVPNAPGSSVDTISRLLGQQLTPLLGQTLVIDNKAGAAGAVGIEAGKVATPDGYTVIAASSSSVTVAPLLQKAISYDPLKDFELISLVALLPNVLVCRTSLPVNKLSEFVAYAKAQGGKFNMASAGPGSVSHLAGVALSSAAGFEALHVPYKGGSQSVGSVVSGETDWTLTPAPVAMALVKGGRLKILGHSMPKGTQPLGPVPSLAETLPGFEFTSWIGLMGPKGLPAEVSDVLRRQLIQALQTKDIKDGFAIHGAVPHSSTGEAFREFLARYIEQTRKAIRLAGVQAE
jgi:tripartite-type tricarboxylate transporter receptor subunit TctC